MAVAIRRGRHVAVSKPLLDQLHGHALRDEERGTRMPQIVEADLLQIVLFRKNGGGLSFLSGIKPH